MVKVKFLLAIIILLIGCLAILLAKNLSENRKPLKARIDEVLADYDDQYSQTIDIQFYNSRTYAFYATTSSILKVVLLGNDAIKRTIVKEQISEYPMIPDRKVSWQGAGDPPTDTYLLWGAIYDPHITQLILESEGNKPANMIKLDEERAIWFKFLDGNVHTPVIISATDKEGKEQFYYGPDRDDS